MLELQSMHRGEWAIVLLVACSTSPPVTPDSSIDLDAGDEPMRDAKVYPDTDPPLESGILVKGPDLLSQSGLYSDIGTRTLAPGVTPFTPRWQLWSDGAEKKRWILLPQGKQIDTQNMDQWTFPVGTKLWKEFKVSTTVVETRFLWKQGEGWPYWWMGAYRWRVDGTDAEYQKLGEPNALGTTHDVPSQVDCVRCHNGVVDVGIGFSAMQLSAPQNSQLAAFSAMGWFTNPPVKEYDAPGQGTERDALTYFHSNCGHCHNEYSWLYTKQTQMVLRLHVTDATVQQTGAWATVGYKMKHQGDPMWGDYAILAGKPNESQVWLRMNVRDKGLWQMPPVCTKVIDGPAVATIGSWITSLPPPPDM